MDLNFNFGDECGLGEFRKFSPIFGEPEYVLFVPDAGRHIGLPPLEHFSPRGGVILMADCTPGWWILRCGGGVANGPGVVIGFFSTCKALITSASRLWYLEKC